MTISGAEVRAVNVFVGEGARGNRAGVVLLDAFPSAESMQGRAAVLRLPATAFVLAERKDRTHAVRWFSQSAEIALCGHGALAAGHVLLEHCARDRIGLATGDGRRLEVRRLEAEGRYEVAIPAIPTEPRDWPELAGALGAQPVEVRWNEAGYALAIFDDVSQLLALAPDRERMAALGNIQLSASAPGAHGLEDIASRVFSGGGKEDAATGSAHAALAPYWAERLGRGRLAAYQASARGGRLTCRMDGQQVWIGGALAEAESG